MYQEERGVYALLITPVGQSSRLRSPSYIYHVATTPEDEVTVTEEGTCGLKYFLNIECSDPICLVLDNLAANRRRTRFVSGEEEFPRKEAVARMTWGKAISDSEMAVLGGDHSVSYANHGSSQAQGGRQEESDTIAPR